MAGKIKRIENTKSKIVDEYIEEMNEKERSIKEFIFCKNISQAVGTIVLHRLGISELSGQCEDEILSLPDGRISEEYINIFNENNEIRKICLMGFQNSSIQTQDRFINIWADSQEKMIKYKAIIFKNVDAGEASFNLPDDFIENWKDFLNSISGDKKHYLIDRDLK